MSTRATVWIINEENGYERFLYHHCDGYMLEEEMCPILGKLSSGDWTVDSIVKAITDFDDAYREVDYGVGWDSEYLYKIIANKMCMEKYGCGIEDVRDGDCKEEKSKPEYRVETYTYGFPIENYAKTIPKSGDKETHYAGPVTENTPNFSLNPERRGYLRGLATFFRNIHEKDLKKNFSLSDYEVNLVFEYMIQTPPNGIG